MAIVTALAEGIANKKELRVSELLEILMFPLLQTVDLGENHIDDAGVARLADALRSHVRLHMLFLDNNKITQRGA